MNPQQDVVFDPAVSGAVVAGFDGSQSSMAAVHAAAEQARLRGVALHVVRAWMFSTAANEAGAPSGTVPSMAEVEAAVRGSVELAVARAREGGSDVEVVGHVQHCKAAHALVAASQEAALVVVSRRGEGGFVDLLLGSTADQVVRHAHSPVLVVRG